MCLNGKAFNSFNSPLSGHAVNKKILFYLFYILPLKLEVCLLREKGYSN